jgi:hypothetical protein
MREIQQMHQLLIHLYMIAPTCFVGRDSSVGIATGYELDGPGIEAVLVV